MLTFINNNNIQARIAIAQLVAYRLGVVQTISFGLRPNQ